MAGKGGYADRARFYTVNGHDLPSVTTILGCLNKPGLVFWAAKVERQAAETAILQILTQPGAKDPEWVLGEFARAMTGAKAADKEKQKAAAIGTAAHAWIEWSLRRQLGEDAGEEPRLPDAAQWAVEAYKDWAKAVNLLPIAIERPIFCAACGFAGTMDLYGEVRDVLTVLDWKTGKAIYPVEHYLQNVAYRHAAKRCGFVADQGVILRLPKVVDDPLTEAAFVPDSVTLDDFLAVKRVWEFTRRMEGKKVGSASRAVAAA